MSILNTSVSGMLANTELADDHRPERRQRQHHRIQECRDRNSPRWSTPRRISSSQFAGVTTSTRGAELAAGADQETIDHDRPRGAGRRLFRRRGHQRQHLSHPRRLVRAGRLRQPGQCRGLLSDGLSLQPDRRRAQFALRPAEGQRRRRQRHLDSLDRRDAGREPALDAAAVTTAADLPSANTATSQYTAETSLVAYDDLGAPHTINFYFTKKAATSGKSTPTTPRPRRGRRLSLYLRAPGDGNLGLQPDTGALTSGSPLHLHCPRRADAVRRSRAKPPNSPQLSR